jgi:hypothetical protein
MSFNIKLVMLVTGESIVGDVTQTPDGDYSVQNPLIVVPMQNDKSGKLGLLPYLQLSEEKSCVFKSVQIRHVLNPFPGLASDWNRIYGSGIITPSNELILE